MDSEVVTIIMTPTGSADANVVTLPLTERRFRDAWRLEGEVINVDMDAARELAREQIRAEREVRFKELDVEYMRLNERGADTHAIVSRKQLLRDAPQDPRIDDAATDIELADITDEIIYGVKAV